MKKNQKMGLGPTQKKSGFFHILISTCLGRGLCSQSVLALFCLHLYLNKVSVFLLPTADRANATV